MADDAVPDAVPDQNICLLCDKSIPPQSNVREIKDEAFKKVIEASKKRGDHRYERFKRKTSITVHENCAKSYTKQDKIDAYRRRIEKEQQKAAPSHSTRSTLPVLFDFINLCLFCGDDASDNFIVRQKKKPVDRREIVHRVNCCDFRKSTIDRCGILKSQFTLQVLARIEGVADLIEAQARYHDTCLLNFYNDTRDHKSVELTPTAEAAQFIASYIMENREECQFSIKAILEHFDGDRDVDIRYLKEHLHKLFGNEIIIHPSKYGHIITYIDAGAKMLTANFYKKQQTLDAEKERENICQSAGKILFQDIRQQVYDTHSYPAPENFLDQVNADIPRSLRLILEEIIIKNKRKPLDFEPLIVTIAHMIISANRPRSFLSPIMIGIGAMFDKLYGSRELIQTLNAAGLCASYDEIRLFQASLLNHLDSTEKSDIYKDAYIQMVFDNADHDVRTIDGRNTFHVEGGIEILTPGNVVSSAERVPRLAKLPKSVDVGQFGKVTLKYIQKDLCKNGLKNVDVVDLNKFAKVDHVVKLRATDFLWLFGKIKYPKEFKGWNGFMESITQHQSYEKSKVRFLPFINNPPSNYETLYTALRIAEDKRILLGQKDIFVTFDEPQFRKSRQILQVCWDKGELLHVHVRLGGLHLLFSFLKSIDFTMKGSGIRDLFCKIYAENSVDKILDGHAYSRSVRGHTLAHLALGRIIHSTVELTPDEDRIITEMLDNSDDILDKIENEDFIKIHDKFVDHLENLKKRGPTAKLWGLYYDLVTLVKQFIEAERSGNWDLHLSTIRKMLPFFHATGHFKYAESAQIYLQDMYQLQDKMDEVEYEKFVAKGYFTIRRSEKYYCGIWSDMAIEQILMRCMKTRGGLTRGRGVSDSVLAKFILNMPSSAALTEVVQSFYNVHFASSEQHVDARPSRIERDAQDAEKMFAFFITYNPFPSSDKITCITSGKQGNDKVNVHNTAEIGCDLIKGIIGGKFGNLKFKRTNRVVSLQSVFTVKINGKDTVINSNLIYQRIIVGMNKNPDLRSYFDFELSTFPLSIFDNNSFRKTEKSKLYDSFVPVAEMPRDYINVIDGGFLMHKVVWPKDVTYDEVMNRYIEFLKKFPKSSYIVFDGYPDSKDKSTKIVERQRRQVKYCTTINFELNMIADVAQESFFANEQNKKRFIDKLRVKIDQAGYKTKQAYEDADRMIVETALELATDEKPAVIVAEDVDILIILSLLNQSNKNVYHFKPSKGKVEEALYTSESFANPELKYLLGFIHAMTGCDTTSAFFNYGKNKLIKLLTDKRELFQKALLFNDKNANRTELEESGLSIIAAMYSRQWKHLNLNELRYKLFDKNSSNKSFQLALLPPTESAAIQHIYRVYLQNQIWLGNDLNPADWGWALKDGKLEPIYGPTEFVPKNFLEDISCSCKKGCGKRCSCVKHGLKCSEYCKGCHGQTCNNVHTVADIVDLVDNEINDDLDADETANEDCNVGSNPQDLDTDDSSDDSDSENEDHDRGDNNDGMRENVSEDESDSGLLQPKRARIIDA